MKDCVGLHKIKWDHWTEVQSMLYVQRACNLQYFRILLVGASLSEPHIDEFAVNFLSLSLSLYIYILYICICRTSCRKSLPALILRLKLIICCTSCRKSLPALILCVPLASCVISKTTRAACGVQ